MCRQAKAEATAAALALSSSEEERRVQETPLTYFLLLTYYHALTAYC